jgi:hypothetical protein
MDHEALSVELCYAQPRRGGKAAKRSARRVIVRSVESGQRLMSIAAMDGVDALRAAAKLLAACEAHGWTIAKIEPFPWADEVIGASANDGPAPRRVALRRT